MVEASTSLRPTRVGVQSFHVFDPSSAAQPRDLVSYVG
jgi:hypothetical protein